MICDDLIIYRMRSSPSFLSGTRDLADLDKDVRAVGIYKPAAYQMK